MACDDPFVGAFFADQLRQCFSTRNMVNFLNERHINTNVQFMAVLGAQRIGVEIIDDLDLIAIALCHDRLIEGAEFYATAVEIELSSNNCVS